MMPPCLVPPATAVKSFPAEKEAAAVSSERVQLEREVLAAFCRKPREALVRPLGTGNINATFLVEDDRRRFVLQRINSTVFPNPQLVVENFARISNHLASAAMHRGIPFVCARPVTGVNGALYHVDGVDECWRAQTYVDHQVVARNCLTEAHLLGLGQVLGRFHLLTEDLDLAGVGNPLPGFHVTPHYLAAYDEAAANWRRPISDSLAQAMARVTALRAGAGRLETAAGRGVLRRRVIHGDPKLDNVIFRASGETVGLFDLDTAGPGLIHYDLGDCLRSACNGEGEQPGDWRKVRFDQERCATVLTGYLQTAGSRLSEADREYIVDGVLVISFELGLRFLTDHLQGDVYFRVTAPGENLVRALGQLRLAESIAERESAIRAMVGRLHRRQS